jgi:hypothetical protein
VLSTIIILLILKPQCTCARVTLVILYAQCICMSVSGLYVFLVGF